MALPPLYSRKFEIASSTVHISKLLGMDHVFLEIPGRIRNSNAKCLLGAYSAPSLHAGCWPLACVLRAARECKVAGQCLVLSVCSGLCSTLIIPLQIFGLFFYSNAFHYFGHVLSCFPFGVRSQSSGVGSVILSFRLVCLFSPASLHLLFVV